jgi:dTDP-4-amino-4,6-dideoxygalactose transaminase
MTRIYLSPPDVSPNDRDALVAALDGGWVAPVGPELDRFESDIAKATGRTHAVGLASGTAGLHLALVAAGIGHDDRVVVSTLTFAATANAVRYVGAEPVLIDSEPQSWNIDPDLVAEALNDATNRGGRVAACIPVDLYGQCATTTGSPRSVPPTRFRSSRMRPRPSGHSTAIVRRGASAKWVWCRSTETRSSPPAGEGRS